MSPQPLSFSREIASVLLKVFAVLVTLASIVVGLFLVGNSYSGVSDGSCTIAVMPITGEIMPYGRGIEYPNFTSTPTDVRDFLSSVENDQTVAVEGVLFEINSPGGTPVAAEDIAGQINAFSLPTAVLIGDVGASGGYMIASAADHIVASAMSEIGSIGVTMSYLENSEKNKQEGVTYVPLSSGKFKDAGSPDKALSPDERKYFESQLDIIYKEFIKIVAQNRNIPEDDVRKIADGSTLIGQQAVDKKLVDQIGDRTAIRQYFAEKLGKDISEISFCEYKPPLGIM